MFSCIFILFLSYAAVEDGRLKICFWSSRYLFFSGMHSGCKYISAWVPSCFLSFDLLNYRCSWLASMGSQNFPMVRTSWLDAGVPPFESFPDWRSVWLTCATTNYICIALSFFFYSTSLSPLTFLWVISSVESYLRYESPACRFFFWWQVEFLAFLAIPIASWAFAKSFFFFFRVSSQWDNIIFLHFFSYFSNLCFLGQRCNINWYRGEFLLCTFQ